LGEKVAHELSAEKLMDITGIDTALLNPELRAASRAGRSLTIARRYWLAGVAEGSTGTWRGIIHYDVNPAT